MPKKYAALGLLLFFTIYGVRAQESLSKDVDYAYLDKLITICKTNYPKFKMYQARIDATATGINKAKLSYFDIFNFSYLYSPKSFSGPVSPSFPFTYQLGFFINIGTILQKPAQVKQAKSELAVAEYDKQSFDLNIEAEVKKRYFTLIQKKALYRIRSNASLDIESMLENVKKRFEMGQETLEKYNQVLVMQTDHAQNLLNTESEVLIAKASLEELLGQKLEDIK
ncbi:TolC family protein [Dyadobacter sp. CY261]|uniref:TolC family protein n=1 Tax=Dyadobacter sp. CY261 TaxID=2907203 RepID=UPI001F22888D|nr:TolC family protein [Dyadobacter sp. CY261]MCF0068925.1 TolC family protein [Dyadobacter sp. CY261]